MATYNVRYKNYCVPQEQHTAGGRYYLDSDISTGNRVLTGATDPSAKLLSTGVYATGTVTNSSAYSAPTTIDVLYVKNTGEINADLKISVDNGASYPIILSDGEAFATEISTSAVVKILATSSTSTTFEIYTIT